MLTHVDLRMERRRTNGAAYGLCGIAGAVAAAYSLRDFHRESLRPLALCLVTGLVFDVILWMVVLSQGYIEVRKVEGGLAERVGVGVVSLLDYFAVLFV